MLNQPSCLFSRWDPHGQATTKRFRDETWLFMNTNETDTHAVNDLLLHE